MSYLSGSVISTWSWSWCFTSPLPDRQMKFRDFLKIAEQRTKLTTSASVANGDEAYMIPATSAALTLCSTVILWLQIIARELRVVSIAGKRRWDIVQLLLAGIIGTVQDR